MWILMGLAAMAAPADFSFKAHAEGCALYLGPTTEEGVVPMWAECHWPDRSFEEVARVMDDARLHVGFRNVLEVEVLDQGPGWQRVWQHHDVAFVADREVLVDVERVDQDTLSIWSWSLAEPEAQRDLPRIRGHVRCPLWEGSWTVTPTSSGVHLVLDNRYDPGEFPAWLVRPFLTGKLAETLSDLRTITQLDRTAAERQHLR